MSDVFRLIMIGAMYENGGNMTHRFLDGHPQMFVYPFESQLGTRWINDYYSAMYPVKYRWPEFSLQGTPEKDYQCIIDEECKVRARTPFVSKFRNVSFDFSDVFRCERYCDYICRSSRTRAHNVEAFFRATFDAWKNCNRTGKESVYVGYSPIITIDGAKILEDFPCSHVLHVVRNPWSAYADTKKRPVPLSLEHYMIAWTTVQYHAMLLRDKYPDRMHIVRAEDVMADSLSTLGSVCQKFGLMPSPVLSVPTWNGQELKEIHPWGTIRKTTPESNWETAMELSDHEHELIHDYAFQYIDLFDYKKFYRR